MYLSLQCFWGNAAQVKTDPNALYGLNNDQYNVFDITKWQFLRQSPFCTINAPDCVFAQSVLAGSPGSPQSVWKTPKRWALLQTSGGLGPRYGRSATMARCRCVKRNSQRCLTLHLYLSKAADVSLELLSFVSDYSTFNLTSVCA